MITYARLDKLITDLVAAANTAKAEDFAALKDIQIGKLYFATDSLIGAVENFVEKVDSEIMKRDEIVVLELGQKITKENEPVLKVKKMSKAEIKAAEAKPAVKTASKPVAKAKAKPAAKPKAAKKPAAPKEK
ncbi:MAG: hypothetical protein RBT69_05880 [Spirochaetia bacterium]|jgi:hypothetical protein|nr:hypothetical protein [Spirochaetia bacterium]